MTRERLSDLTLVELYALLDRYKVDHLEGLENDRTRVEESLWDAIQESMEDRYEDDSDPVHFQEERYGTVEDYGTQDWDENFYRHFDPPQTYQTNRIHMMLRDPQWAFVYWDILTVGDKAEHLDGKRLALVVYQGEKQDLAGELPSAAKDFNKRQPDVLVPVSSSDRSWYVNLPVKDSWCRAALVYQMTGYYHFLCLSNLLYVPRGSFSDYLEVLDSFETDALLALSGVERLGVPGTEKDVPQRINKLIRKISTGEGLDK